MTQRSMCAGSVLVRGWLRVAAGLLAFAPVQYGQVRPLAFEVATVKPTDPKAMQHMGIQVLPGGRVVISAFRLKLLICTAFKVSY